MRRYSLFRTISNRCPGLVSLLLLGCMVGSFSPLHAQNRMGGRLLDPLKVNPIQQWQGQAAKSELLSLMLLEGALDPDTYRLGPGDVFSVVTGGAAPLALTVPITADGYLVLPEVGTIAAAGRVLGDVQNEATEALKRHYHNLQVEVSLIALRQFYVHITGAVPEPGRFLTPSMARVDDALQQAFAAQASGQMGMPLRVGSAIEQRPERNEHYGPSLRNVLVTRTDGTQQSIDLMRYYTTGDTRHNPYLLDGDVVAVPTYHLQYDAVRVSGEVAYPGYFDYRPGDTLLDLLILATGSSDLSNLGEVRLTHRNSQGQIENLVFNVPDVLAGTGQPVAVAPGDHINVPLRTRAEAAIQGLVKYPGTYPIEEGKTTLRELLAMAGGLVDNANPSAAFMERRKTQAFKEEGKASDLDFFSRYYIQTQALHSNRYITNVEAALLATGEDIVLYDQDLIVVPRDEGVVYVMGNVPRPGYVPFVDGQNAAYYIQQAGGKAPLSQEVYVFEEKTGKVQKGEGQTVRLGDTIFVDRTDIAESPEIAQLLLSDQISRRQTRIMTTQTLIAGLTAITGIITTYVAVRNLK